MAADDVEQLQLEALAESLQAQQRTSKSMWRDGCVDNHERHLKRLLRRRERNYGMTEPLTIGALAALAISMTAEAAYKGFVGEIVKDSYISLKTKLFKVAGRDFDELEKAPDSSPRQAILAEIVDKLPEDERLAIKESAQELIVKLTQYPASAGIVVRWLRGRGVEVGDIEAGQGIGAIFDRVEITEDFKVGNITIGSSSGKTDR